MNDFEQSGFRQGNRRGLTLVEVMFSVVVMSTMMVAALGSVGGAAKTRIAQKEASQGLTLARQLLSEIVQTRYADLVNPVFGVEAGELRTTWDDVDDYNGLDQPSACSSTGVVLSGATGWRREVKVTFADPVNPNATSGMDKGLKHIKVTVTSPSGRVTTLKALRSNTNGYEHVPGAQVTYTSHVGISLQIGMNDTTRSVVGVTTQNLVP
jgi:MSHA pilin protein MshD